MRAHISDPHHYSVTVPSASTHRKLEAGQVTSQSQQTCFGGTFTEACISTGYVILIYADSPFQPREYGYFFIHTPAVGLFDEAGAQDPS